jgi:hypothetical protein
MFVYDLGNKNDNQDYELPKLSISTNEIKLDNKNAIFTSIIKDK